MNPNFLGRLPGASLEKSGKMKRVFEFTTTCNLADGLIGISEYENAAFDADPEK